MMIRQPFRKCKALLQRSRYLLIKNGICLRCSRFLPVVPQHSLVHSLSQPERQSVSGSVDLPPFRWDTTEDTETDRHDGTNLYIKSGKAGQQNSYSILINLWVRICENNKAHTMRVATNASSRHDDLTMNEAFRLPYSSLYQYPKLAWIHGWTVVVFV